MMKKLLFFLVITGFCLALGAQPNWLKVSNTVTIPDMNTQNSWVANLMGLEEFWVIEDRKNFFETLEKAGLKPLLRIRLERAFEEQIELEKLFEFSSFTGNPKDYDSGGIITLTETLKAKIPGPILRAAYSYLLESGFPVPNYAMTAKLELQDRIKSWAMPPEVELKTINTIIPWEANYLFPVTASLWPHLPENFRIQFVYDYLRPGAPSRQALSLEIEIDKNTNIGEIALAIAGERDSKSIERYLKILFAKSGGEFVSIPLQTILHPFIRKNHESFNIDAGPNCFNCGVSVNQSLTSSPRFLGEKKLQKILKSDYKLLAQEAPPRTGDFLLYKDTAGEVVHVATFVAENILFTKNGTTKFAPYFFQEQKITENLYFPEEKFILEYYRIKPTSSMLTGGNLQLPQQIKCRGSFKKI